MNKSVVPDIARRRQTNEDGTVTLSTGVRVRLHPIPPGTMEEARMSVRLPQVPNWTNPEKNREEPNPNDPVYLDAMEEYHRQRIEIHNEVVLMFGIELVDPVPDDDGWLKKVQWLASKGRISISGYDPVDPIDREFLYKKHCAIGTADWKLLYPLMGITPPEVKEAGDTFQSDGEG